MGKRSRRHRREKFRRGDGARFISLRRQSNAGASRRRTGQEPEILGAPGHRKSHSLRRNSRALSNARRSLRARVRDRPERRRRSEAARVSSFRDDRLSSRFFFPRESRNPPRSQNAQAGLQSANARKQYPRNLFGGCFARRLAYWRNFYRERTFPRPPNHRRHHRPSRTTRTRPRFSPRRINSRLAIT